MKINDTPILTGYQIFHNYIRPRMSLDGKTPSEVAGIKVEGENKWVTLIQNASKKQSCDIFINLTSFCLFMLNIRTDLIVRVCIITTAFSIISYYVMQKNALTPDRLIIDIPLLFAVFGIVILISILYDLRRYNVMNTK